MSTPLDQLAYNQEGAYLPIKIMSGDDLPGIIVSVPIDITTYTFDGTVFDSLGAPIVQFTVTTQQSTPTGIVSYSLTTDQCALITSGSFYRMRWTVGLNIRTFAYGSFEVIKPWQ